jgi:uncharacterized protein with HEPN domain
VTRRTTRHRLEDIRAAADDASTFVAGLDEAGFAAMPRDDRRTYRAIKNALSEIGEAVKALPPDLLARHPGLDWRGWAGLRDIVSHEYFRLEMSRLRLTVLNELPGLLDVVLAELSRAD